MGEGEKRMRSVEREKIRCVYLCVCVCECVCERRTREWFIINLSVSFHLFSPSPFLSNSPPFPSLTELSKHSCLPRLPPANEESVHSLQNHIQSILLLPSLPFSMSRFKIIFFILLPLVPGRCDSSSECISQSKTCRWQGRRCRESRSQEVRWIWNWETHR